MLGPIFSTTLCFPPRFFLSVVGPGRFLRLGRRSSSHWSKFVDAVTPKPVPTSRDATRPVRALNNAMKATREAQELTSSSSSSSSSSSFGTSSKPGPNSCPSTSSSSSPRSGYRGGVRRERRNSSGAKPTELVESDGRLARLIPRTVPSRVTPTDDAAVRTSDQYRNGIWQEPVEKLQLAVKSQKSQPSHSRVSPTKSNPFSTESTTTPSPHGLSTGQVGLGTRAVAVSHVGSSSRASVELEPFAPRTQSKSPRSVIKIPKKAQPVELETVAQPALEHSVPASARENTNEAQLSESRQRIELERQVERLGYLESLYHPAPHRRHPLELDAALVPIHSRLSRRTTLYSTHLDNVHSIARYRRAQDALLKPTRDVLEHRKLVDSQIERARRYHLRLVEGDEARIEEQATIARVVKLNDLVDELHQFARDAARESDRRHLDRLGHVTATQCARPAAVDDRLVERFNKLVTRHTSLLLRTTGVMGTTSLSTTTTTKVMVPPVQARFFADRACTKSYAVPWQSVEKVSPTGWYTRGGRAELERVERRKLKEVENISRELAKHHHHHQQHRGGGSNYLGLPGSFAFTGAR